MGILLNTSYNGKHCVLSFPSIQIIFFAFLEIRQKHISNSMIIIRIISNIYRFVYQHVSKYHFVNLCQLVPKAWNDILIDNGHEAETTFSHSFKPI